MQNVAGLEVLQHVTSQTCGAGVQQDSELEKVQAWLLFSGTR
jgi:hypothetical protein